MKNLLFGKHRFEHHLAMTMGSVAETLEEAFTTYVRWESFHHV